VSLLRVAICGAEIGAEHLDAYLALSHLYQASCIADPDQIRATPLVEKSNASYVSSFIDKIVNEHHSEGFIRQFELAYDAYLYH
jgi:hypothetical protein